MCQGVCSAIDKMYIVDFKLKLCQLKAAIAAAQLELSQELVKLKEEEEILASVSRTFEEDIAELEDIKAAVIESREEWEKKKSELARVQVILILIERILCPLNVNHLCCISVFTRGPTGRPAERTETNFSD